MFQRKNGERAMDLAEICKNDVEESHEIAYDKLVEYCKSSGLPEANRDFVVRKIQSLRGSFRKELKKVKENWKSGKPDRIYVPSLWYFEHLLFVKDEELPAGSFSTNGDYSAGLSNNGDPDGDYSDTEEQVPEPSLEAPVPWETLIKIEPSENEDQSQQLPPQQHKQQNVNEKSTPMFKNRHAERRRKRTIIDTRMDFMKACSSALKSQKQFSEFDLVGMNIAKKLERMDPTQALYAESIITSVLLKGLKNQLQETTSICTNLCNEVGRITTITSPIQSPQYRVTPSPSSSSMSIPDLSANKSEELQSDLKNGKSPTFRENYQNKDLTDAEMQL
ncbi:unnamed protein product [Callosobruchus maculatus]|uniref:MADF domain-containing protein n=1 Tax=Callosobruchus maculatus TaxID=64391 RepID=A0A653DER4_CALMS|nr:unnamed protein product [Callosobruchus maculatus]